MKFLTVGLGGTTVTFNGEPTDAPWLCPIVASRHVTNARKRRITGAPAATYTTSEGCGAAASMCLAASLSLAFGEWVGQGAVALRACRTGSGE